MSECAKSWETWTDREGYCCLTLCNPTTAACQAPLSMGFSRQEYWSGLPFPPPGDLPDFPTQESNPHLLQWQAHSLPLSHRGSPSQIIRCAEKHSGRPWSCTCQGGICPGPWKCRQNHSRGCLPTSDIPAGSLGRSTVSCHKLLALQALLPSLYSSVL